jgi:hypothetical protein
VTACPQRTFAPPNGTFERAKLQSWLNFISSELQLGCFCPLFDREIPAAVKAIFRRRLDNRLAYLEQHLVGNAYLMGNEFSIADGGRGGFGPNGGTRREGRPKTRRPGPRAPGRPGRVAEAGRGADSGGLYTTGKAQQRGGCGEFEGRIGEIDTSCRTWRIQDEVLDRSPFASGCSPCRRAAASAPPLAVCRLSHAGHQGVKRAGSGRPAGWSWDGSGARHGTQWLSRATACTGAR